MVNFTLSSQDCYLVELVTPLLDFIYILSPVLIAYLYGLAFLFVLYLLASTFFIFFYWREWILTNRIMHIIQSPLCMFCHARPIVNLMFGPFECCIYCVIRKALTASHTPLLLKFMLHNLINFSQLSSEFGDEAAVVNYRLRVTSSVDEAQKLLHKSSQVSLVIGLSGVILTLITLIILG